MRAAAGIATLLAHAVAFVGLGSLEVELAPEQPLEVTTIELVELPAPTAPTQVELEPLLEPEVDPEPIAAPEPIAPSPKAPAPRRRPPATPTAPVAQPTPAPAATPGATAPAPGPSSPAKGPQAPAAPRKLGQRFSNASSSKGRQRGTAERCAESIVKPVPSKKVKPKFPAAALRSDISGDLVLRASVDQAGTVSSVKVVKSPGASVETPAKTAFAQWRFSPATACGKPVASTYAKAWKFSGG